MCAGTFRVRAISSAWLSSRANQSSTLATASGSAVWAKPTMPAPPGMPVQPPGPQGLPTTSQSKASPIASSKRPTCQLPE